MLICIPDILSPQQLAECRKHLAKAAWQDGRTTTGAQSAAVKNNWQLPVRSKEAIENGQMIVQALLANALFLSATLPLKILPPMFNRYGIGQNFGVHVDNAIRTIPDTGTQIRTDLSMTLFLNEPEEYEGGELVIETLYGAQEIKLPAGHIVVYPATSLHQVMPIIKGERLASFFWLQSMVRDEGVRTLLFDLDQTIQQLSRERGDNDPACVRLTGIYHNFIRQFADC